MKNNDLIAEANRCLDAGDYESAYQQFLEGAIKATDPDALCGLANMYNTGDYVGFDYDKCAHYYELADKAGADIPENMYVYIGCTYERGNTYHDRDPLRAAYWYRKAIAAGVGYAVECLGELEFKEGKYMLAHRHFMNAKKQSPCALYYLGRMYEEGLGVEKNTDKAVEYYRRIEKEYPDYIVDGDDHAMMALERLGKLSDKTQ